MTQNAQTRREALEQNVLLLCPSLGWWRGFYQLPSQKTEVRSAGKTVDKTSVTTPRATLMTNTYPLDANGVSWKSRFQSLDNRLRILKDRYSVDFPIHGVRIIPKARGQEFMQAIYGDTLGTLKHRLAEARANVDNPHKAHMLQQRIATVLEQHGDGASDSLPVMNPDATEQSIAYDLWQAAQEFCDNWEGIKQQIASHNDVYAEVANKLPKTGTELRRRFYIDVVPVELAGGNHTKLSAEDLAAHHAIVQESCRRRVEAAISEMIEAPRSQLAEALVNLETMLAGDGKVTAKTFNPVRAAIAKIRMFDFVADDELLKRVNDLESRINNTTPKSLREQKITATNFAQEIHKIHDAVNDELARDAAREQFGRNVRRLL